MIALFTGAIHRRNRSAGRAETDDERDRRRRGFDDRLLALVHARRAVPGYATFARHLHKHLEQWFTFVFDPSVEPTNWGAEQAIRPAVVNRKAWGGNKRLLRLGTIDEFGHGAPLGNADRVIAHPHPSGDLRFSAGPDSDMALFTNPLPKLTEQKSSILVAPDGAAVWLPIQR